MPLLITSLAINIMATFVHNEPTSLVVIQEAGLPEAFYKAIELGLEPAIEVRLYAALVDAPLTYSRLFKLSQTPSGRYV